MDPRNNQQTSLLFQVEQDVAKLLVTKLERHEISLDRASQIAHFILAHLPDNLTDEQTQQILPSLDDEFTELADIVYKDLVAYEQKFKEINIKNIRELLNHEHFQQVSNQARNYVNSKLTTQ